MQARFDGQSGSCKHSGVLGLSVNCLHSPLGPGNQFGGQTQVIVLTGTDGITVHLAVFEEIVATHARKENRVDLMRNVLFWTQYQFER